MAGVFRSEPRMYVQQADLDAASRLLNKMYSGKNFRSLPMWVFGTDELPRPGFFRDPGHSATLEITAMINKTLTFATAHAAACEWHLNSQEIDQLQIEDPRVETLRKKLPDLIGELDPVKKLRADRFQVLLELKARTFDRPQ